VAQEGAVCRRQVASRNNLVKFCICDKNIFGINNLLIAVVKLGIYFVKFLENNNQKCLKVLKVRQDV
jgi:hypothetical protein